MEKTLKKLKEGLSEKDFKIVVESMRRKIKKGLLEYNLYLFEQTILELDKLDNKNPDLIDKDGTNAIEKKTEENDENISQKLDEAINLCEYYCRELDEEIALRQLEEESKQLLEGVKYE